MRRDREAAAAGRNGDHAMTHEPKDCPTPGACSALARIEALEAQVRKDHVAFSSGRDEEPEGCWLCDDEWPCAVLRALFPEETP